MKGVLMNTLGLVIVIALVISAFGALYDGSSITAFASYFVPEAGEPGFIEEPGVLGGEPAPPEFIIQTSVSSCTNITTGGIYNLTTNLTGSQGFWVDGSDRTCIYINSSGVIFSCMNGGTQYSIRGTGPTSNYGIFTEDHGLTVIIEHCDIRNHTVAEIGLKNSSGNWIRNNFFDKDYGSFQSNSNFIKQLTNAGNLNVYNNTMQSLINASYVIRNNYAAMSFYNNTVINGSITSWHNNIYIDNSTFIGPGSFIDIDLSANTNRVRWNNFTNCGSGGSSHFCIRQSGTGADNDIENNIITNCNGVGKGIWIIDDASDIYNNTVTNCTYGIYTQNMNNNLSNNKLFDNVIDFYSSTGGNLTDLVVSSTTLDLFWSGALNITDVADPGSEPTSYDNVSAFVNITGPTWALVNMSYNETLITAKGILESSLELFKHNGTWYDASDFATTYGVDIINNYVYANITSFSTFAPMGATGITACMNLTTPNQDYVLSNNLTGVQSGWNRCIYINASNVSLDCGGAVYNITGNDSSGSDYGIYVDTATNVTIDNCYIQDYYQAAIVVDGANNTTVVDSTLISNDAVGPASKAIQFFQSPLYANVTNCNMTNNRYGVYIPIGASPLSYSLFFNNTFYNNSVGAISDNGGIYNVYANNTFTGFNNNIARIFLQYANYSTVENNTINYKRGISLSLANNTTVRNNVLNGDWSDIAIDIVSSKNNLIENNLVSSYGSAITATSTSWNNNFTNNVVVNSSSDDFYIEAIIVETIKNLTMDNVSVDMTLFGNIGFNTSEDTIPTDPASVTNISKHIDIINVSAAWAFVNISYNDTYVTNDLGLKEASLMMYKNNTTGWFDASDFSSTYGVDTANNYVYANITSFSTFAPMGSTTLPVTTCMDLNQSNNIYNLTTNLTGTQPGKNYCLFINATNVTLDCGGQLNNITGNGSSSWQGVLVGAPFIYGHNSTIQNCFIYSYNVAGVVIAGSTQINITIRNNNLESNNNGIRLFQVNNVTVTNNNITNNNNEGIYIQGSQQNATITNNFIANNLQEGIKGSNAFDNGTIANNIIQNNTFSGFEFGSINDIDVINNTVNDNGEYGFEIVGGWVSNFVNNTATNNTNGGLRLTAGNHTLTNFTINGTSFDIVTGQLGRVDIRYSGDPGSQPTGFENVSEFLNVTEINSVDWLLLNMTYNDAYVSGLGLDENNLTMLKNNGTWYNAPDFAVTSGVDTTNDYVWANITDFSIFAPMAQTGSITNCANITVGNTYYNLQNNLTGTQGWSTRDVCINILADNVTLDCNGYHLNGTGLSVKDAISNYNITSFGFEPLNDLTIKNCTFIGWSNGDILDLDIIDGLVIRDNYANFGGVVTPAQWYINNVNNTEIINNYINGTETMWVFPYDNLTIEDNVINYANGDSVSINCLASPTNVSVRNNSMDYNTYWFSVYNCDNTVIENNNFTNTRFDNGLYIDGSDNTNISNNRFENNDYSGLSYYLSYDGIMYNNYFIGNDAGAWGGQADIKYDNSNGTSVNSTLNNTLVDFVAQNVRIKGPNGTVLPNNPGYGGMPQYLFLTNTSASGYVYVNVSYQDSDLPTNIIANSTIKLYKNVSGTWTPNIGTPNTIDEVADVVYANVTNFGSLFRPFGDTVNVTNCKNITTSNTDYNLITNLTGVQSGWDRCIHIDADNVTLNCGGQTNNITALTGSDDFGIYVNYSRNVTIENCFVDGYNDGGIRLQYSNNCTVKGNRLDDNNLPIDIAWSHNNTVINNTAYGSISGGISALQAMNNLIINNTVRDGYDGVFLINYVNNTTIVDNILINNTNGIGLAFYSTDNTIENNMIADNDGIGIELDVSDNNRIRNNIIMNNDDTGIVAHESDDLIIDNNTIILNTEAGIYIGDVSDPTIDNITITNNNVSLNGQTIGPYPPVPGPTGFFLKRMNSITGMAVGFDWEAVNTLPKVIEETCESCLGTGSAWYTDGFDFYCQDLGGLTCAESEFPCEPGWECWDYSTGCEAGSCGTGCFDANDYLGNPLLPFECDVIAGCFAGECFSPTCLDCSNGVGEACDQCNLELSATCENVCGGSCESEPSCDVVCGAGFSNDGGLTCYDGPDCLFECEAPPTCDFDPSCCGEGGFSDDGGISCYDDPGCSIPCAEPTCDPDPACCEGEGFFDGESCYIDPGCSEPCPELPLCDFDPACCGEGGFTDDGGISCYDDPGCSIPCAEPTCDEQITCGDCLSIETCLWYAETPEPPLDGLEVELNYICEDFGGATCGDVGYPCDPTYPECHDSGTSCELNYCEGGECYDPNDWAGSSEIGYLECLENTECSEGQCDLPQCVECFDVADPEACDACHSVLYDGCLGVCTYGEDISECIIDDECEPGDYCDADNHCSVDDRVEDVNSFTVTVVNLPNDYSIWYNGDPVSSFLSGYDVYIGDPSGSEMYMLIDSDGLPAPEDWGLTGLTVETDEVSGAYVVAVDAFSHDGGLFFKDLLVPTRGADYAFCCPNAATAANVNIGCSGVFTTTTIVNVGGEDYYVCEDMVGSGGGVPLALAGGGNGLILENALNSYIGDNVLHYNNATGLLIIETNDSAIEDNNVTVSGDYGIYISDSYDTNFTNNIVINSGRYDFYSDGSQGILVEDLITNDTTSDFIYDGDVGIKSAVSPAGDPAGYQNLGEFLNITGTSWMFLNLSYNDTYVTTDLEMNETNLTMYKYNGTWYNASDFAIAEGYDNTSNYVWANITDFSIFGPMGIPPGTDLEILNVTYGPTPVYLNTRTNFTVNVTNNGPISATNITMAFYFNDSFHSSTDSVNLASGEWHLFYVISSFSFTDGYRFNASVTADQDDTNETNNNASVTFAVIKKPGGGGPEPKVQPKTPLVQVTAPRNFRHWPKYLLPFANCSLVDKLVDVPTDGATILLEGELDEEGRPSPQSAAVLLYGEGEVFENETNQTTFDAYVKSIKCISPEQYGVLACNETVIASYEIDIESDHTLFCYNYEGASVRPQSITVSKLVDDEWTPVPLTNLIYDEDASVLCADITGETPYIISGYAPIAIADSAWNAIQLAEKSIEQMKLAGEDTSVQEGILQEAREAYAVCDYEKAIALANQLITPPFERPVLIWLLILIPVLAGVYYNFYGRLKRKKPVKAHVEEHEMDSNHEETTRKKK